MSSHDSFFYVVILGLYGCQMDVETTLCAYLVVAILVIKQDVVLASIRQ